jgi:hypothetical protein
MNEQHSKNIKRRRDSAVLIAFVCAVVFLLAGLRPLVGQAAEALSLEAYLTSVTTQKMSNGNWQNATTFTDGDQVRVNMAYEIPANTLSGGNRTLTYQLPNAIRPIEAQSGDVVNEGDNHRVVGHYTIDTNGKITIAFDESFDTTSAFQGTLHFEGTVSNDGDESSRTIHYGNQGTDITVIPQSETHDLSIAKAGTVSDDGKTITYTVTASTENGTGDTVDLKDRMRDSTGSATYNQGSLTLYKVAADGSKTKVSQTAEFGSDGKNFVYSGLPALAAGEKYEITYTVAVTQQTAADGAAVVSNAAVGTIKGKDPKESWSDVTVSRAKISKTGYYDSNDGLIHWTVVVNNPQKRDLAGYQFSDTLPSGTALVGKGSVQDASGVAIGSLDENNGNLSYAFGSGTTALSYTIAYTTTAPASDGSVKNTATVTEKGGTHHESTGTAYVTHRDWNVSKNKKSAVKEDGGEALTWESNITLPDSTLTAFTYTDTIKDAVDADGKSQSGTHYGTAAEIQASLEKTIALRLSDGSTLGYNNSRVAFSATYYDAKGDVVPSTDTTAKVQSFKITVTPKTGENIAGQTLGFSYSTHAAESGMATGDTWRFSNTAAIPGHEATADHKKTKPKPLEKQVSTGAGAAGSYTNGSTEVTYDGTKGILYYRILLRTTPGQSGDITLTDTLPAGASLVDGSVSAMKYQDDYYSTDVIWPQDGSGSSWSFSAHFSYKTESGADGTTLLRMTLQDGYNSDELGQKDGNIIGITYRLSVAKDSDWDDMTRESKTYTNKVSYDGETDSQKTTVKRSVEKVQKTGAQVLDSDGKPTNVVRYQVAINPGALDLDPDADTITLTDTLTITDGAGAYLDLNSIKLYAYDVDAADHLGDPIDSGRYQIAYDDITHRLTVKLPDQLAAVLVYQYDISPGNIAAPEVSNQASLTGGFTSGNKVTVKESTSSATASQEKLTLYKVDSENYKDTLDGASFSLEKWNGSAWETAGEERTTTSDGRLTYTVSPSGGTTDMAQNVLYRIKETTAPKYYKTNTDYRYVVMLADGSSASDMAATLQAAGVSGAKVHYYNTSGGTIYVPNTYNAIKVVKNWTDKDNQSVNPGAASVTAHLWQQTETRNDHTVTVVYQTQKDGQTFARETYTVGDGKTLTLKWTGYWWNNGQNTLSYSVSDFPTYTHGTGSAEQNSGEQTLISNPITQDVTLTVGVGWNYKADSATESHTYVATGSPRLMKTITLNADNHWTAEFNKNEAPAENADGSERYTYTVTEDPVPGYTATYQNNGGIQTGTINITNKDNGHHGYVLPGTGGAGALPFVVGGLLIAVLSLWALNIKQEKEWTDGQNSQKK